MLDDSFRAMSGTLRVCVYIVRHLSTDDFSNAPDGLADICVPFQLELVGKHLRSIHGVPSAIQPHIEALERTLTLRGSDGVLVRGKRYLTWHEAALSIVQRLYFDACFAANPLDERLCGEPIAFVDRGFFAENIDAVVSWLAEQPETDWEEIDIGLRREQIIFQASAPLAATAATAPPSIDATPGTTQSEVKDGQAQGTAPAPGDATGDETHRAEFSKLPKARRLAYFAFQYVAEKTGTHPGRLLDHDAWDWLNENGIDEPAGIVGELADYRPPNAPATWVRYLSEARKALGEQKRRRGTRATTGHSVIRRDEI